MKTSYCDAIREGFEYLLQEYPEVFVIGQGLWSPWYVGRSMKDLDKKFGVERVIDTPVSESACTGAAVGASLCGKRPIVVHPRMDFMILGIDPIVNQAAKWSHMLGGQAHPAVTIRSIVNRGGEQGAQHSQVLHSWFAHVPGLRVVMPATPSDARDLLIQSVLCNDPVLYIDDRWLYEQEEELKPIAPRGREGDLSSIRPQVRAQGTDITLVAASYSVKLCMDAAQALKEAGISAEVLDIRVVNPVDFSPVVESVKKTGRLLAVDGGWTNCGFAGEIVASVVEKVDVTRLKHRPRRLTLTDAPAPTSKPLEDLYYTKVEDIVALAKEMTKEKKS